MTNKIKPLRCVCGEALAFNVPAVARYMKNNAALQTSVTDAQIRNYITKQRVVCVEKSTKFHGKSHSSTSAHISRTFFDTEVIEILDKGIYVLYIDNN